MNDATYADLRAKFASKTQMSLRRAQIDQALKGNTTMLIFLGKVLLGQSDGTEKNRIDNSTWEEDDDTITLSEGEIVKLLRSSEKS